MSDADEIERRINELETKAGKALSHRRGVTMILEHAARSGERLDLDAAAFAAKSCWKISGVLQRIPPVAQGRDALAEEFARQRADLAGILKSILKTAEPDVRNSFEERFLAMTPPGLKSFLELCHDLSWIKNTSIDDNV